MSGGTAEIHLDSDPLVEALHQGANGAASFQNTTRCFPVLMSSGLAAENSTQGTSGTVTAVTDNTITVSGVTWDNGDTLKVYKTTVKNSVISRQWVDVSRGWKTPKTEMIDGWRPEDIDEKD